MSELAITAKSSTAREAFLRRGVHLTVLILYPPARESKILSDHFLIRTPTLVLDFNSRVEQNGVN